MRRVFSKKYFLLCVILPEIKTEESSLVTYKKFEGLYIEDPWERVKSIFSKDDYGNIHPKLQYVFSMCKAGLLGGALYGGLMGSTEKSQAFLRVSEAEIFPNARTAKKMLANESIRGFFSGAALYAPKFGIFLGVFTLISSCCELYRNKPSVIDSIIGGCASGALCRVHYGIKGLMSGGIVGGVLGTFYGIMAWGICKITKIEQSELKYAEFAYSKYRKQLLKSEQETENEVEEAVQKSDVNIKLLDLLDK